MFILSKKYPPHKTNNSNSVDQLRISHEDVRITARLSHSDFKI